MPHRGRHEGLQRVWRVGRRCSWACPLRLGDPCPGLTITASIWLIAKLAQHLHCSGLGARRWRLHVAQDPASKLPAAVFVVTEQPYSKIAAIYCCRHMADANIDVVIWVAFAEWAGHGMRTTCIPRRNSNRVPAGRSTTRKKPRLLRACVTAWRVLPMMIMRALPE